MKTTRILFLIVAFYSFSCTNKQFYTMGDFAKVPKNDAHYHIYSDGNGSPEQAQKDNFSLLAINTFSEGCEHVFKVQQISENLEKQYPQNFDFAATFCLDGWDDSLWVENTLAWLDSCLAGGAVAVKVWKNIGMEFRDKDSALIMIDDPKFDPVFQFLNEKKIPLVGHLGEPRNCWLPVNEMTTKTTAAILRGTRNITCFCILNFLRTKNNWQHATGCWTKIPGSFLSGATWPVSNGMWTHWLPGSTNTQTQRLTSLPGWDNCIFKPAMTGKKCATSLFNTRTGFYTEPTLLTADRKRNSFSNRFTKPGSATGNTL